jgi:hypothetical protein
LQGSGLLFWAESYITSEDNSDLLVWNTRDWTGIFQMGNNMEQD